MGAVPFQDATWLLSGEPGDVTELDQQPGRTGGADAFQVSSEVPVASTSSLSCLSTAF